MTVIERAQAAIVAELWRQGDLMDGDKANIEVAQVDGSFQTLPLVKAVLNAIREPNEPMIAALWPEEIGLHHLRPADKKRVAVEGWRLMIDAALKEG